MFVIQAASTKGRGGIVTSMRHYARMFTARGITSAALYNGPASDTLRTDGIAVIDAPHLTDAFAWPHAMSAMKQAVRSYSAEEPQVVIVHSDKALGRLRHLWPRAVFVTPCHSDKLKRKRHADLVVALNPEQQSKARAFLDSGDADSVLLGNPFVPAPPPQLADGPARLVFCGRFVAEKGAALLLRAAAALEPKAPVLLIGAGPLETELRELAGALGVEATFTGWLAAPFAAMRASDILVLPSSHEGLPYMLLEAMHHGLAIVAGDNPGNRYALGNGAFGALFAPDDVDSLRRQLAEALAQPDVLRSQTEAGRASLPARFGAAAFWSRFEEAVHLASARRNRLATAFHESVASQH